MTITEIQRQQMLEAAKPLIKWLNDNCHPHSIILVEPDGAELVEGIASVKTLEFLRD